MVELEIRPSAKSRLAVLTVLALALALTALLVYLLTGGGREFFERTTSLTTWMPDGTGLAPGSEVRLSGIGVGHVTAVDISGELDPQRVVKAEMQINTRYLRSIPSDSQTSIGADTLVGFKYIDIAEGKSPIPVAENGFLKSEPMKQATDRADMVAAAQKELSQIDQILQQLSSPDTTIGHFLLAEDEYDKLLTRVTGFAQSIHQFVGPGTALGNVVFKNDLYKSLRAPALNADKMLQSMQKNTLLTSGEQYDKALKQLKDLHASVSSLAPRLRSEEGYDRIVKLLRDTDRMILSLTVGEGASAKLLNDAQLYEKLYGPTKGIDVLLRDFRENPQKYMRYQVFNKKNKKAAKPAAAAPAGAANGQSASVPANN